MAKLIFIGKEFAGRVYELLLETTTVGRGDENTLAIHDASVSQTHCTILVNGPEVIVRDEGARNGTFVDGVRLQKQQRQLLSGQIVRFGSIEARLELEETSFSDTATGVTAVHAHVRHSQAQLNPIPQAPPGMTLETGSPGASEDHTLILPRSTAAGTKVSASPVAPEVDLPRKSHRFVLVVIGVVLIPVIAGVLWWIQRNL